MENNPTNWSISPTFSLISCADALENKTVPTQKLLSTKKLSTEAPGYNFGRLEAAIQVSVKVRSMNSFIINVTNFFL